MFTKRILSSAAIAALIAGSAVAESHTTAETDTDATATAEVGGTVGDTDATAEAGAAAEAETTVEGEVSTETETEMAAEPAIAEPTEPTEAMVDVDIATIDAEALTGVRVYDQNDKWIGEVSAVLMGADGTPAEAVIDVGGFLGLGEKPVALSFNNLSVKSSGEANYTVYVALTEEELEAMPDYEG